MASPVSEVVYLPLKPGATPEVDGSPSSVAVKDMLRTLGEQPGMQRCYYGTQIERPDMLMLLVDWDKLKDHEDFQQRPIYKPFVQNLVSGLLDGPPILSHAQFKPFPPAPVLSNAPTTEIFFAYFPTDYSEDLQKKHHANFEEMMNKGKGFDGFHGFAGGWVVEDSIAYEKAEGGQAKAFVGLIGWDSKEAHMAARETDLFKDNIHLLRGAPQLIGMEVFHVKFTDFTGGLS